jgi:hypothetical protein
MPQPGAPGLIFITRRDVFFFHVIPFSRHPPGTEVIGPWWLH